VRSRLGGKPQCAFRIGGAVYYPREFDVVQRRLGCHPDRRAIEMTTVRIIGRSSSHFTRTVRVIAHECRVDYEFQPRLDLMSRSRSDYGDNPALKLPILETPEGAWFGALNIARELARRAPSPVRVVWPEDVLDRTAGNAQELVLQGMATEVSLIMRGLPAPGASPMDDKARESLTNSLVWLDAQLPAALRALPAGRLLSFLEVSTFCFVRHLGFRGLADCSVYANLTAFCAAYAGRPSVSDTEYAFDC
jgi:glutathione S-transferase